jgi:hypothetical protein
MTTLNSVNNKSFAALKAEIITIGKKDVQNISSGLLALP